MKRQCNNKCFYWTERDCSKNRFETRPYSRVNYRGVCDHFQAYVGRDGISYPIIDEWGKGAKYWDVAWNPMIGCRKASEGCANCYAARLAAQYPELQSADGGFEPHPPKHLKCPPKSGVVFCGNMTDIFGEWVDGLSIHEWISALSPTATNLVLTKRAGRLRDLPDDLLALEHVFFGITAENQERLERRAPQIMKSGARKKWISLEPLLSPVNIAPYLLTEHQKRGHDAQYIPPRYDWQYRDRFDWVVVGAESGHARRPCKLEWVRQIVEDCQQYGVPVFVKQLDIDGKLEKDIAKFPTDLMIRQVPWGKEA